MKHNRLHTWLVTVLVLTIGIWLCMPVSAFAGDSSKAKVNTSSRLNVRSGPGTNYKTVGQLAPGEVVEVIDRTHETEGWVQVSNGSGLKGYVSCSFLQMDYTPDEQAYRADRLKDDYSWRVPFWLRWYYAAYLYLLGLDIGVALVFLALAFVIEAVVIVVMRTKYRYDFCKPSAVWLYLVLLLYASLTLPGIFIHKAILMHKGFWPVTLFTLMLLATGCAMLHAAWRIKLCGMRGNGKWRIDGSPHYQTGRWLGNILWCLLLIPLAKIWWKIGFAPVVQTADSFLAMLITMAVIVGVNMLIAKWVWPYVIVRYLFPSANQGVVHIMSFVLVWGMMLYEGRWLDYNFKGFTCLLAYVIGIIVILCTLMWAWTSITEHRCGNCHSFDTAQTGLTDLGYEYRTNWSWKDINESSVNRRISGSEVVDAKGLVETTNKVSKWQTHHTCYHCQHKWDMDHEETVGSTSRTVRKEWTERY